MAAATLALSSFLAVVLASSYWRQQPMLASGLLIGLKLGTPNREFMQHARDQQRRADQARCRERRLRMNPTRPGGVAAWLGAPWLPVENATPRSNSASMSPAAAAARQVATSVSVAAQSVSSAEASASETSLIQVCVINSTPVPRGRHPAGPCRDKVAKHGQQVVNAQKNRPNVRTGYNYAPSA